MSHRRHAILCVLLSIAPHGTLAQGQSPDTNTAWLAEHYTKYEYRIPMRDGVRLLPAGKKNGMDSERRA